MSVETPIAHSALLRAKLELASGPLHGVFARLWSNERLDQLVPSFLVLLHQIMRASVPLMECAVRRCEALRDSDVLAAPLRSYFVRHIEEEQDHDVWALEDLHNAGFDPQAILDTMPAPEVAQLAGAQYYWVLHHHPVMLLGYIMVLEAYPPSASQVDDIRDNSGVPETAFKTLRMHGGLDPKHGVELDELLDSLPLTRRHVDLIGMSMLHTVETLAASVQELRPIDWPKLRSPGDPGE